MKSKLYLFLATALMLIFSSVAFAHSPRSAQDSQQPREHSGSGHGQGSGEGHGQGMMTPEAMLDHLSKELNLTDDQQAKIKPIVEDNFKQMQELRKDTSTSDQERHAKMKQLHENAMSQVRPILNAEQQKKLEELMSRRSEHAEKGHHDGDHDAAKPQ